MSINIKQEPVKKIFLKHVRLQNYRTIQDTKTDLEPGLNIIIGKNGVGKSNFIRYLKTSIDFNIQSVSYHNAHLVFSRNETTGFSIDIKSKIEKIIENGTPIIKTNLITFDIYKDNTLLHQFDRYEDFYDFLNQEEFFFSAVFITHGLPADYLLVEKPFSFRINQKGVLEDYTKLVSSVRYHSHFLENIFNFIFYKSINLYQESKVPGKKELERIIPGIVELLIPVESVLAKYSDIKAVRLNKNYNTVFDRVKSEFSVNNLSLEFKVGRQWLPFSHLSDGTRRLFYIISEIVFPTLFHFQESEFALSTKETNKIVLIEEPELGLHPHQLDSLMHFLQESSEEHQVIITTHAPQVLDILDKNQLNKIIIARLSRDGTILRHLTRKAQEKAALYMEEEAYLSDYWRYSDLEV